MGATVRGEKRRSYGVYKRPWKLTLVGGVAFWATTIATSLTPFGAEFRAISSTAYAVVIVGALLAGLFVAYGVSYCMLFYFDRLPTKNPIQKSLILSFTVLIIIQTLATLLHHSNTLDYFVISTVTNIPRFLSLGIFVGYLYSRF
jgi:hypothetical protein